MKVAIYGNSFEKKYAPAIVRLFESLNARNISLIIHRTFYDFIKQQANYTPAAEALFDSYYNMNSDTKFIFSIGGDGTFLQTVSYVQDKQIPIIGLNIGRLGFLADIPEEDIDNALTAIFEERYEIEERALLQVQTSKEAFTPFNIAMNDVTIHKMNAVSMITIHAFIDDVFLNAYWADGLIISSPTGSTAYSMSVGGPIVLPNCNNFIITPIAPHNLTVRPLVVPDNSVIRLQISGRTSNYLTSLDSRLKTLDTSEEVVVQKAPFKVKILKLPGHSFYATLRNKLMWGLDKRN